MGIRYPSDRPIRFGAIDAPGGLLLGVTNLDTMRQALEIQYQEILRVRGEAASPEILEAIRRKAREQMEALKLKLAAAGVPGYFQELFSFQKKRGVEKFCRHLVISEDEFLHLVHNSASIGYRHSIKRHEFIPAHLKITNGEVGALFAPPDAAKPLNPGDFARKLSNVMKERKVVLFHLLANDVRWHCFFFTFRDLEQKNHWEHGAHIHFVNDLWPEISQDDLGKYFEQRHGKSLKPLHIRFEGAD